MRRARHRRSALAAMHYSAHFRASGIRLRRINAPAWPHRTAAPVI